MVHYDGIGQEGSGALAAGTPAGLTLTGGTPFTPVPDADGYDANIRSIAITPVGQLAAYSGTGAEPSCSLVFQVRIDGS